MELLIAIGKLQRGEFLNSDEVDLIVHYFLKCYEGHTKIEKTLNENLKDKDDRKCINNIRKINKSVLHQK